MCNNRLESFGHCLWRKDHHDTIHYTRDLETACRIAWDSRRNLPFEDFRVFGWLYDSEENAKRVGWVQWWFWRLTPKFVGKLQAMVDNDSNKSFKSIVRDVVVLKFFFWKVVYEDIRYFSHKMRKSQILSHAMKDKRKDHAAEFWTNSSISLKWTCSSFSQVRTFFARIRWGNAQNNQWFAMSP